MDFFNPPEDYKSPFDKYGWLNSMVVDSSTYKSRLKICNSCDYLQKTVKICKDCKCFMPAKTRLKTSSCPQNKWQSVD